MYMYVEQKHKDTKFKPFTIQLPQWKSKNLNMS